MTYNKLYLSGPIDNAPDRGNGWRDKITPRLVSLGYTILNPLHKLDPDLTEDNKYADHRRHLLEKEDYNGLATLMKRVRQSDLDMVDQANALILYVQPNIPTCGTWEEVFRANQQNKLVYVVGEGGIEKINFWLWGLLSHRYFYNNFDELFLDLEADGFFSF